MGEHELRPGLVDGLVDRIEVEARPIELALRGMLASFVKPSRLASVPASELSITALAKSLVFPSTRLTVARAAVWVGPIARADMHVAIAEVGQEPADGVVLQQLARSDSRASAVEVVEVEGGSERERRSLVIGVGVGRDVKAAIREPGRQLFLDPVVQTQRSAEP